MGSPGFDWSYRVLEYKSHSALILKLKINGNILTKIANKVKSLFTAPAVAFA